MSTEKITHSQRWYRRLLRMLPFDFRWEHGREMEQDFKVRSGEEDSNGGRVMGLLKLWWETIADIGRTAPREHLDMLRQDTRFALRSMRKNPGFTIVAVLTLALGIGASVAMFSVVDGVLLRPLRMNDPDGLALVYEVDARSGTYEDHNRVALANFQDWQEQNRVFERMAAFITFDITVRTGEEDERLAAGVVTDGFFSVLREQAYLGRTFLAEEDQPGNDNVAVLSYDLWQRRFGGDPDVIGRQIGLGSSTVTVVGVLRPDFDFLSKGVQVWSPYAASATAMENRKSHVVHVVARLRSEISFEKAQTGMANLVDRLSEQYPEWLTGWGVNVAPVYEEVVGQIRPALLVLLAAVGFLLLIAASNIANLLLARATVRRREVALRSALGASRARLIRQLLTESLLLSLLGGGLGVLLAWGGIAPLLALAPSDFPRRTEVLLDPTALGFALAVAVLSGLVFGLAPAWQGTGGRLGEDLSDGGRTPSERKGAGRTRKVLIVLQVALSLLLLTGAGLLSRTFLNLLSVESGFDQEKLLTFNLQTPSTRYPEVSDQTQFFERVVTDLETVAGVESVGVTSHLPLAQEEWTWSALVEGDPPPPEGEKRDYGYHPISADFFEAMRIPLHRGRFFRSSEAEDAPFVMIVNEAFVERFFRNREAMAARISINGPEGPWREIVGVVGNVRYGGLARDPAPAMYVPHGQKGYSWFRDLTIVVRTKSNPRSLVSDVRRRVRSIDAEVPMVLLRSMEDVVSADVAQPRFAMILMVLFAFTAALLASVGIYGVVSYDVSRRQHEVGVRLALGASTGNIFSMVVLRGMRVVLIGIGVGVACSVLGARLLSGLLFGVGPNDPATLTGVVLLFAAVAFLACYVPARRAMKVDPMVALRYE